MERYRKKAGMFFPMEEKMKEDVLEL